MTAKIVIAAYDSHDGVGGPFVWLQRMPNMLRERGFDIRVALYYWPGQNPDVGIVYRALTEQKIPVTRTEFADSETNVRWLLDDLRNDTPDVLIADNVIPAMLARRFLPASLATIGILRSDDDFYHGIIDRFVAGEEPDQLSAVVCVSEYLRNRVVETGYDSQRAMHIPSGTPVPEQHGPPPDNEFRVAYVGRLAEEQKQISATTKALIHTVQQVPGTVATIYGDGPDLRNVECLLAQTDAPVTLAGRLGPQDLLEELQQTHAIVLLSDYEGTPTAVMEAMACGVVPVCFNIRSGIPELICHNENGILVDDRDESVVAAIRKLRDDRALLETLSANARRRIISSYSSSLSAEKWAKTVTAMITPSSKPIATPEDLDFPAPHPGFARQDVRSASPCGDPDARTSRLLRKARKIGGRIRRCVFGAAD